MKPFDLNAAIAGAPLVTRDGREVTEFHYYSKSTEVEHYPIGAVIDGKIQGFTKFGAHHQYSHFDLFLKSEKKKLYVGIKKLARLVPVVHDVTVGFYTEKEVSDFLKQENKNDYQIVEVEIDC